MYKKIKFKNQYINIRFENLNINICDIGGGKFEHDVSMHTHGKFFYELHLICGGKGLLRTDSESYPLSEGTFFMTGPLICHEQITDPDDSMVEYCLGFNISKIRNKKSEIGNLLCDTTFRIGIDNGVLMRHFERIADEFENKDIGYIKVVENELRTLLIDLIRYYESRSENIVETIPVTDNMRIRIIEHNIFLFYDTVTEDALSAELNLSKRQLIRFIKKQYGKTFSQLRREARIAAAKNYIREGMDIEAAARKTGYTDAAYLKKLLKT